MDSLEETFSRQEMLHKGRAIHPKNTIYRHGYRDLKSNSQTFEFVLYHFAIERDRFHKWGSQFRQHLEKRTGRPCEVILCRDESTNIC